MSREVPQPPHPSVSVLDAAGRFVREWFDWIDKFAKNIRFNAPLTGTVAFSAATSATVTFATPEASANYNVSLDPPENKTFWVTSKATTGFTVNASGSTSVTVPWTLHRR